MVQETNAVKNICKKLGITQKELAKRIGVSENSVSEWARGVTTTPKWALKYFADLPKIQKYDTIKQLFLDKDKE